MLAHLLRLLQVHVLPASVVAVAGSPRMFMDPAPPALEPTWSTYVLGDLGDSCQTACTQSGGRACVPHVHTNDSDAIFARLGVECYPGHAGDGSRNGTWWAPDQPSFVAGKRDPRYRQCLGYKQVPYTVDCGAAVSTTRRVCNCRARSPGDGPVQMPMRQICNTTGLADGPHYINDHTLVQDEASGNWHLFGIFHHEPADPEHEVEFIHATATEPDPARWNASSFVVPGPSDPMRYALTASLLENETHIWAPHCLRDEPNKRWVMVYQGGNAGAHINQNNDAAQIKFAVSTDLDTWHRLPAPTGLLFTDICVARDPMLVAPSAQHSDGQWTIYYCRCDSITGRLSGVGFRTSRNLLTWSEPAMALVLPPSLSPKSFNSGNTESPFVFKRGSTWYLSICAAASSYRRTMLFSSSDPYRFEPTSGKPLEELDAHCAEYIGHGEWMTSAGWAAGGVFLSKLNWME